MHLQSLKHKKSMAQAIDKQMEADIESDLGVCKTCLCKITTYWNVQQTHQYEVCSNDEAHHKRCIDYIKDED